MAKAKSNDKPASKSIKARDKVTKDKIVALADDVAKKAYAGREPQLAIPIRARATRSGTRNAASSRWATTRPSVSCST
ncbi:MAG: hypothetical protein QM770_18000 [Tepidisphaeraceae bacterium]